MSVDLSDIPMNDVKPAGDFEELPAGKYVVRIESSERKGTKDKVDPVTGLPDANNGKNFYLQLGFKVFGGPNDGKVDFERLNLWNANATAVSIAKSQLKSIFLATGVEGADSSILHGKWMVLERKLNGRGQLTNHYESCPPALIPTNPAVIVASNHPATQPHHITNHQSTIAPAPLAQKPSWA